MIAMDRYLVFWMKNSGGGSCIESNLVVSRSGNKFLAVVFHFMVSLWKLITYSQILRSDQAVHGM